MINMDKLFNWGPDTRTEHQKKIDKELLDLMAQYEEVFKEDFDTESTNFDDEQLIKDLKRCLKENITMDKIYPWLNEYDEDCDY